MVKIAIFASGNGSNAQRIVEYFSDNSQVAVECIIYNVKDAYVSERAKALKIESCFFDRDDFYQNGNVLEYLKKHEIDWIVLAGFLWLVPSDILTDYPHKIINIHPALLPKYGGKGMYGMHVHEAVIANKEVESGITIHLVDAKYDEGAILFQSRCTVTQEDTPATLADKVHALEYRYFPEIIEQVVLA